MAVGHARAPSFGFRPLLGKQRLNSLPKRLGWKKIRIDVKFVTRKLHGERTLQMVGTTWSILPSWAFRIDF